MHKPAINRKVYQDGFSEAHADAMYDYDGRRKKARTILAVLQDFFQRDLDSFSLLDIGTSTGIIDSYLADHFGVVVGVDIDRQAVTFAKKHHKRRNLDFALADAMELPFPDSSFDVLICAQIYEHVPNSTRLMSEVYRVLRPGGVCYFSAGNRLNINEPHYGLPFLSIIPRSLAHLYLRLAGRGTFYYEKHLTYWGLRKLVREFEITDYTQAVVERPEQIGRAHV